MTFEIDIEKKLLWGLQDFLSSFVAILGSTGSGKSNAIAVIAEELLSAGLPLVIVDVEGEHWGLKQEFNIVVVGHSDNTDIECQPRQGGVIAEWAYTNKIPIVLDISGFDPDERMDLLVSFFDRLWDMADQHRTPYQVILEECHMWIPQSGKTPVQNRLTQVALQGRKRGLGIIMASQRAAKVNKDVLGMADKKILMLVNIVNDLSVYKGWIPRLEPKEVKEIVYQLRPGEALVIHKNPKVLDKIKLRKRRTFDGGYTPGLDKIVPPPLKSAGEVLEGLQALLRKSMVVATDDAAALKRQLKERDEQIALLTSQVQELEQKIIELRQEMTVNKVVVGQIEVATAVPVAVGAEAVAASTVAIPDNKIISIGDENEDYQSSRQVWRSTKQQRRNFDNMLEILRKAPKHQRAMVKFLMDFKGEIKLNLLAQQLDYSSTTLQNEPPLLLIEQKLISREKHIGHQYYQSKVDQWVKDTCPSLDHDKLIDELKAVLG